MASEVCPFCPNPVNPHDLGTYKLVEGWVKVKSGDSMVLRRDTGNYAHEACVNKLREGQAPDQESLFDE